MTGSIFEISGLGAGAINQTPTDSVFSKEVPAGPSTTE